MIKKLFSKTKGSAFQTALFISMIVLLLLTSFITLTYTHVRLSKIVAKKNQLEHLVEQGVRYVAHVDLEYQDSLSVSPLNEGEEIVLYKKHWGLYDVLISKARISTKTKERVALIGGKLMADKREALYLTDRNTPLVVVGDASIKGPVRLPEKGIKAGSIEGKFFKGKSLVNGPIRRSRRALPSFSEEKEMYFKDILDYRPRLEEEVLFDHNNKLSQPFNKSTKWLYSRDPLRIENLKLSGNVIIKSDTLVTLNQSAILKDVIVVAPRVIVQSGFEGVIQIVASHSIEIQPKVYLGYPSSIVIMDDPSNTVKEDNFLTIGERSKIFGSIAVITQKESVAMNEYVQLKRRALLKGELYSEYPVMLRGKVEGSIYTDAFVDDSGGSRYINHLYNGVIDSNGLPEIFAGIAIEGRTSSLIQWLD